MVLKSPAVVYKDKKLRMMNLQAEFCFNVEIVPGSVITEQLFAKVTKAASEYRIQSVLLGVQNLHRYSPKGHSLTFRVNAVCCSLCQQHKTNIR